MPTMKALPQGVNFAVPLGPIEDSALTIKKLRRSLNSLKVRKNKRRKMH